jgi:transaldolase/glucose-6-phosphate isomerase
MKERYMTVLQKINSLQELHRYGQSVWLDYIHRSLIDSGELKRLVDDDGLRGVTSNPSIFEKAITGSNDYIKALDALRRHPDLDAKAMYETIAIRDIQDAADVLRVIYDESAGKDGFVSLEVSPTLARDTNGTIAEARRLWTSVNRPNLMVKVPGTPAGVPAIEQLISEGININVTLLFSIQSYERVAKAYMSGLEKLLASGGNPSKVASVASFFISRIDSLIDGMLEMKLKAAKSDELKKSIERTIGKVAVANAKLAYRRYHELYSTARWTKLSALNAQPQRLLWASTSTKNPKYRDVFYVEELIGSATVNTMPPVTVDAYRDHGKARNSLIEDVEGAEQTMRDLKAVGISMRAATDKLLEDGIKLFADAFDQLLVAVDRARSVRATA